MSSQSEYPPTDVRERSSFPPPASPTLIYTSVNLIFFTAWLFSTFITVVLRVKNIELTAQREIFTLCFCEHCDSKESFFFYGEFQSQSLWSFQFSLVYIAAGALRIAAMCFTDT